MAMLSQPFEHVRSAAQNDGFPVVDASADWHLADSALDHAEDSGVTPDGETVEYPPEAQSAYEHTAHYVKGLEAASMNIKLSRIARAIYYGEAPVDGLTNEQIDKKAIFGLSIFGPEDSVEQRRAFNYGSSAAYSKAISNVKLPLLYETIQLGEEGERAL